MIGPRIGYALLLLAALGLDLFCGSVWTLALTLLLVLTPLGCIPLHLWAVKQIPLRLDAPVNLGKGETGTLRVQIENKTGAAARPDPCPAAALQPADRAE